MKQLTLQEHYNLIKEGKGHKDMFLKAAKSQFPNIVPNAATFEQTSTLLKQRSIISENIWGVATGKTTQPDWFSIFNDNINEAKYDSSVASSQEEPVKNNDKKVSKQVEDDLDHNFDYKDPKNRDNVYGQEFLEGYYAEMKDPKNSDKTVDELLELVSKNLAGDRLYYVKDGQFGVKGLGYTEDAPGLGAGSKITGKYISSGYGDLKENLNNMIKLMDLFEGEYYMPETKEKKKPMAEKKKVKKSAIADRVKEIEEESTFNAMEDKIQAMAEEIEMRENKLAMIDENEDLQEFINPVRIKEMQKEIDELKKTKLKMENEYEKKSKGRKPKEVIDEAEDEETEKKEVNKDGKALADRFSDLGSYENFEKAWKELLRKGIDKRKEAEKK
jgi:hypothetical protein